MTAVDPRSSTLEPGPDRFAEARRDLAQVLGEVTGEIAGLLGGSLRAVLLVGSFARDEGGWIAGPKGLIPHNDVDLVVIVERGARSLRAPLASLAREISGTVGFEIDLWPIDAARVTEPPPTLFWLDVALGGRRVLWGAVEGLRLDAVRPGDVSLDEAARLLANRATGLALSNLAGAREPRLRAWRHAHKAVLACGDALLLEADLYRGTVAERAALLQTSSGRAPHELVVAYRDAARFRTRPESWQPRGDPGRWRAAILRMVGRCHLEFEHRRSRTPPDPAGFARHTAPLYGLADLRPWSRAFHRTSHWATSGGHPAAMHPRERLARASVALAYSPRDPSARAAACRALGTSPATPDSSLVTLLEQLREKGG